MHKTIRILILVAVTVTFSSCLSMDVEVDVRNRNDMRLNMEYRIPLEIWELGVFDGDSAERAIPVSRRDAEETATLHPDVRLVTYNLEEREALVIVTVAYSATSVDGLRSLWGTVSDRPLELSFSDRSLSIPLSPGFEGVQVDRDQRDLVELLFSEQTFRVAARLPADATDRRVPGIPGGRLQSDDGLVEWIVPMGGLVLTDVPAAIEVTW